MGCRIMIRFYAVMRSGNEPSTPSLYDHGANRHFSQAGCRFCKVESLSHWAVIHFHGA
jgi:hypothetical protein